MLQKKCDRCKRLSFGTDGGRLWICPYCHKDITHVKAKPPNFFRARDREEAKSTS
jgi:uncharacterized Zn finger protein (UPF0148 family)